MTKFIVYSDGGSRGNPGPGAYGFVIKLQNPISNLPAGRQGFQFSIFNKIADSNIKIQNNIVDGSGFLGEVTNNQAEYNGILAALEYLKSQIPDPKPASLVGGSQINSNNQNTNNQNIEIDCFLDSQLIVEQMNGNYKIKNEGLKPLYWEIRQLIMDLGSQVTFKHIPRDENNEADLLVNEAIDKALNRK